MTRPVSVQPPRSGRRLRKRVRLALIRAACRSGLPVDARPGFPGGRVVMFHAGRCGSTVLADLLDQHPRITWDGEILKAPRWRQRGDLQRLLAVRLALTRTRFYGFETKFFHLRYHGYDLATYLQLLDRAGFDRFIVVRRNHFLRQVVSSCVGRATRTMRLPASATPCLTTIRLEVDGLWRHRENNTLLGHFQRLSTDYRELEQRLAGKQALWLSYEDHIACDPGTAYGLACDFLGVEQKPVKIRLGRTNPFPLRDMISNFEDVERVLTGTPYEWMLHD